MQCALLNKRVVVGYRPIEFCHSVEVKVGVEVGRKGILF